MEWWERTKNGDVVKWAHSEEKAREFPGFGWAFFYFAGAFGLVVMTFSSK